MDCWTSCYEKQGFLLFKFLWRCIYVKTFRMTLVKLEENCLCFVLNIFIPVLELKPFSELLCLVHIYFNHNVLLTIIHSYHHRSFEMVNWYSNHWVDGWFVKKFLEQNYFHNFWRISAKFVRHTQHPSSVDVYSIHRYGVVLRFAFCRVMCPWTYMYVQGHGMCNHLYWLLLD